MKVHINSKLPNVSTTIFTVMSKLATENNAINLSQGFPGFSIDDKLIELVNNAMKSGFNQYAPMPGLPALLQQIAIKTERCYGYLPNTETQITITAGATQAIYTAITACVKSDDEVIVFEPAYDCYEPAIEACGAKTIHIALQFPNYSIDWNLVKDKITAKTKLIIINSPNNPSGSILTQQDLDTLYDLIKDKNIFVISDEVYEHIVFDGALHVSVLSHAQLRERSFVVSSFGKTFHTTGWKMGYCIAPEFMMKEFRKFHQYIVFSCNMPIQAALAEYLKDEKTYTSLPEFYQTKRDYFLSKIKNSRFIPMSCKGSYFQLLNYAAITNENDFEYAKKLTELHKIASIPLSSFYHDKQDNKVLRFCFAKTNETLDEAAKILNSI